MKTPRGRRLRMIEFAWLGGFFVQTIILSVLARQ